MGRSPHRITSMKLPRSSFGVACALAAIACKPAASTTPPDSDGKGPGPTAAVDASDVDAVIAASDLPPTHKALPGDPMAVSVHRLKNGLTVYISTDRQKPRFSAWIAVRAGSRHDPAASTGLAHYLEHMLFKGTDELGVLDHGAEAPHMAKIEQLYRDLRGTTDPEKRKAITAELDATNQQVAATAIPNEFDRIYSQLGISDLNAFTSFDQTVYVADVPTNRLEAWAAVEGERFADPVFRLFFTELEAVYEEKNLSLDNPWWRVFEATNRNLFPKHPYGTQTTIGEIEHLKVPAYQDMVDYFNRWYAPNNMAIVLAGDIDAERALPALEKTLGRLKPRPLASPEAGDLTRISARVQSDVVAEGEQMVQLAWQTVPVTHADEPAVTVMDWLLDNSTSGLLNIELELSQKVPDAGSSASFEREAGWFTVRATLREGQTHAEVEKLLLGVVEKLRRGEFTQADVDAIVLNQDSAEKYKLENNYFRVSKMTDAFVNRRAWSDVVERDRKIRKVTRDDVIRVANAYLGTAFSAVYRKDGKPEVAKIEKPKITPVEIKTERRSRFAEQILGMPAAELQPEWLVEGTHYARVPLPGGQLLAVKNTRNDLFTVTYKFERGLQKERMLCYALDVVQQSAAGDLTVEALRKKLFALGSTVQFECGKHDSSIEISGIDANMPETVKLTETWLREVKIDPKVLQGIADNEISERRDSIEEPDSLAWALVSYVLHDKESEYLLAPTNAQITAAKPEALAKLSREFLDHEHRVLYFGPRPAAEAAKVLALGKGHKKLAPRKPNSYRKVSKPTVYFTHRDVAKSTIGLALPTTPQAREKRPAARLLSEYFGGGMNTLLFQELREARGLVYYAYGTLDAGSRPKDAWALRGGLGTQSDKTSEALKTFFDLLTRPLDATRFATARATLDQEFRSSRIDPRFSMWWVDSWDQLGEKSDPRPWIWEQIRAMTQEQLQGFAGGFAKLAPIVGIVGNRDRIDIEAIRKLGQIVEVAPEKLFSYGAFPAPPAAGPAAAR
jgi:predicted Zn-dependent peptidase